ncbi:MAG: sugar-transfer associated ATP-grasp domain-containing protein [Bacilli bacterium]
MKSLIYKIKCFKSGTIKSIFNIVKKIHNKTHKCRLFLFIDIVYCSVKYGAGPYDYQEFEFYNLNSKERKTYLTRVKNNAIVRMFNNKEIAKKFDDKVEFNKIFNKYLKRDWLYLDNNYEEFVKFCESKKDFIAKPVGGSGGEGIELIKVDKKNYKKTYEYLISNNKLLVEEKIIQNKKIGMLNKTSVNTFRIVSFFDGKETHILNVVFKIGNGGVTDNFSSGSMYTFVRDGKIIVPAIDRDDNIFYEHPISKINIVGYEIPNYDKAIDLVKECAKKVPEVKYVGWDVAITDSDAVIIEGNCFPGVYQIKPSFVKEKVGLIPIFEKAMKIKIDKL